MSTSSASGDGKGKFIFLGIVAIIVGVCWMRYLSTLPRYQATLNKVEAAVVVRHTEIASSLPDKPRLGSTAVLDAYIGNAPFETRDAEVRYHNAEATMAGRTIQHPASVLWPQDGQWHFRIEGGVVQIRTEGTVVSNKALDSSGNYVPITGAGVIWPSGLDGFERMKSDALYMAVIGRLCLKDESEGQCQARWNVGRAMQREQKTTLNPEWFVVGRCSTLDIGANYMQLAYNSVPADLRPDFWGGNGGGVRVTFTNRPSEFVDCAAWSGGQTSNVN